MERNVQFWFQVQNNRRDLSSAMSDFDESAPEGSCVSCLADLSNLKGPVRFCPYCGTSVEEEDDETDD